MASLLPSSLYPFDWPISRRTRRLVHCTGKQRRPLFVNPIGLKLILTVVAITFIWISHNSGLACQVQKTAKVGETSIPSAQACVDGSWECKFARLDKMLNDAARHPVDGRIYLPLDDKETSSLIVDNLRVVDTNSGDAATFYCPLQLTPNSSDTPDIVWVHNGRPVAVAKSSGINVFNGYNISHAINRTISAATLIMKNVSWSDRGVVECQQRCPEVAPRFCRQQAFRLRVAPTGNELFPLPMANVTVPRDAEARLLCVTGFTHPLEPFDMLHGFIWRFNRQWLEAPKKHPLRDLIFTDPDQRQFRQYIPPDAATEDTLSKYGMQYSRAGNVASTLFIPKVDARRPARVECWVQPDSREVWLMQAAYLHVV